MRNKWWKFFLCALAIFFFIVIVPLLINKCYQSEQPIIFTIWDAPDVLAYYGTILSAVVTVGVLAVTISFTKKQLQRESFVKAEKEKWDKIESLFSDVLDKINPIRPINQVLGSTESKPVVAMGIMREFTLTCNMATDQLSAYLNGNDNSNLNGLICAITNACKVFSNLYEESIEAYNTLSELQNRDTMKKVLITEANCAGSVNANTLKIAQAIVNRTNGLSSGDLIDRISHINDKIIKEYHKTYRPLLKEKSETFDRIQTEMQEKAEGILQLWKRT